ncbi:MAG: hypothetical protein NT027_01540 [Proteobacteria bacterium]|nr:hypothetical protein [Pseudomonadota bacterium]
MKVSNLMRVALLGISSIALGEGAGSTGGGHAVVCRDQLGGSSTVELLDLWEAKAAGKQIVAPTSDDEYEQYAAYLKRLRYVLGGDRPVKQTDILHFQQEVDSLYHFIDDEEYLPTTSDFGEVPTLPSNCKIEQLATFFDRKPQVKVRLSLWNQLNSVHKAALLIHEVAAHQQRFGGKENTTLLARRFVGQMFSENLQSAVLPIDAGVPSNAVKCTANEVESGEASFFFVYPNPSDPQSGSILQFQRIIGRVVYDRTIVPLPISIDPTQLSPRHLTGSSLWYQQVNQSKANFNKPISIGGYVFSGYKLKVQYESGKPFTLQLESPQAALSRLHYVSECKPIKDNTVRGNIRNSTNVNPGETAENNPDESSGQETGVANQSDYVNVRLVRDFQFGWIEPNLPASCTAQSTETMLIELTGVPGKFVSISPLGEPKLTLNSQKDPSRNEYIAISKMSISPFGVVKLNENGFAQVEVFACREAASSIQKRGWYGVNGFNVAFQYQM